MTTNAPTFDAPRLARECVAILNDHAALDSFTPTDAVRAHPSYDGMTPEQRAQVAAMTRSLWLMQDDAPRLTAEQAGPYSVTGYKPFRSLDGGGYNATLRCNGAKVAELHDGGYGGQVNFTFTAGDRAEAAFRQYVTALPGPASWAFDNAAMFIAGLIDLALDEKELDRFMRKRSTHVLMYEAGKLSTIKPTRSLALTIAAARSKYPDAIIVNALADDEARALLRQWQEASR